MTLLLVVWLVLLTLAVAGVNSRLTIVRHDQQAMRTQAEAIPAPLNDGEKATAVLLLVSDSCGACDVAIAEMHSFVSASTHDGIEFVVLTNLEVDRRVMSPLVARRNDELYRRIYRGASPYVYVQLAGRVEAIGNDADSFTTLFGIAVDRTRHRAT